MRKVSCFMYLAGVVWLRICIVYGNNDTMVIDRSGCGKTVSHNDLSTGLKVSLKLRTDSECEGCKDSNCPSVSHGACSLNFIMDDDFLKKMYKVCVDVEFMDLHSCYTQLVLTPFSSGPEVAKTCTSSIQKTSCSSKSVKMEISSLHFCGISGHLVVYLKKVSTATHAYELTDYQRCQSNNKIDLQYLQYEVSSWYNSSVGGQPLFCDLKADFGFPKTTVCLKFQYAFFPEGGATLMVGTYNTLFTLTSGEQLIYSFDNPPALQSEYCLTLDRFSNIDGVSITVKPHYRLRDGSTKRLYDHAFIFTIYTKREWDGRVNDHEISWASKDGEDSEDYSYDSHEADSQFQKKVIIAVAVFCVALFVCMYYACTKSKQQAAGAQQEAPSEVGPEMEGVRRPYYMSDPIRGGGQSEMYTYIYQTSTLVDSSEPAASPSHARERNDRAAADETEDQFDQPPPEYAHVSTPPPAPAQSSGSTASVPGAAVPPAPPPPYESLFPDRNH